MKKTLKILIILSYIITILLVTSGIVNAVNIIDPDFYAPTIEDTPTVVTDKAGAIFYILQVISVVISVIVIIILGLKYIMGSVEQRADYKKTMIPYIVGLVLLVGTTTLVRVISDLVNQAITE